MIKIQTVKLKSHILIRESFSIFSIDYDIFKINKENEYVIRKFYFKSFDYKNNNKYYLSEITTKNKRPFVICDYNKAQVSSKRIT